jgi:hypothetical protein
MSINRPAFTTKLYQKVIRQRVQDQWPTKPLCVLNFGPNSTSMVKESPLLSTAPDQNIALRAAIDLI